MLSLERVACDVLYAVCGGEKRKSDDDENDGGKYDRAVCYHEKEGAYAPADNTMGAFAGRTIPAIMTCMVIVAAIVSAAAAAMRRWTPDHAHHAASSCTGLLSPFIATHVIQHCIEVSTVQRSRRVSICFRA